MTPSNFKTAHEALSDKREWVIIRKDNEYWKSFWQTYKPEMALQQQRAA